MRVNILAFVHSLVDCDSFVEHVMDEEETQEKGQLRPEDDNRCSGETQELPRVPTQPVVDGQEDEGQGEDVGQRSTHVEDEVELRDGDQGPPDGHVDSQYLLQGSS